MESIQPTSSALGQNRTNKKKSGAVNKNMTTRAIQQMRQKHQSLQDNQLLPIGNQHKMTVTHGAGGGFFKQDQKPGNVSHMLPS